MKTEKKSIAEKTKTLSFAVSKESIPFFPLTNFIQGQLAEIRESGINPIKFTYYGNRIDSTWIKIENLTSEFSDLLQPVIDSASMSKYFKETSFFDETLNTITLIYDPTDYLPSEITWLHWDIYINPENKKISRVYMVKRLSEQIKKQITLIPEESCRIITLNEQSKDIKSAKVSDILIKWNQ